MERPIPEVMEIQYEIASIPDLGYTDDPATAMADTPAFKSRRVEIVKEDAEELIERIHEAIDDRAREGYYVDHLVLGVEEFTTVDAYWRYVTDHNSHGTENSGAKENLPVDEVTVVPGSMIYAVVPSEVMVTEYYVGEDE